MAHPQVDLQPFQGQVDHILGLIFLGPVIIKKRFDLSAPVEFRRSG